MMETWLLVALAVVFAVLVWQQHRYEKVCREFAEWQTSVTATVLRDGEAKFTALCDKLGIHVPTVENKKERESFQTWNEADPEDRELAAAQAEEREHGPESYDARIIAEAEAERKAGHAAFEQTLDRAETEAVAAGAAPLGGG